jgi:subtilisin family serine protease
MLRAVGRGRGLSGLGEWFEAIESRLLLSGAFDTVGLTALRADPAYAGIDGSGVGVAILDTGLFSTHQDLQPNFTAWYDAVRRTDAGTPFDPEGHGTHVAGTAAARNPNIGVATQARLIGVRVLPAEDESQPRYDTVAEGLQWVIDHRDQYNIRVVNMSLGVPSHNFNSVPNDSSGEAALIRRLEQLGVTVVSASGNGYANFATAGASTPAVFSSLSVASTWEDNGVGDSFPMVLGGGTYAALEREGRRDRFAGTSQRSTLPNQVAAPGQTIFSSWNGDGGQLYNTISGTSMASPLVTGLVALMQDAARTFGGRYLSTSEVVSIVRDSADVIIDSNVTTNGRYEIATGNVTDLPETGQSFKRVNAYNAIRKVRMLLTGTVDPGPTAGDADNTIAKAISLGKTDGTTNLGAEAFIGSDGSIQAGATDVDLYKFELVSRGNVTLTLTNAAGGTAFNSFLRLFNAGGTQFGSNDDAGGGQYSQISTGILAPGIYYVGVSAAPNSGYNATSGAGAVNGGSTGDYQLVVSLSNPDPNGVATGAVAVSELPKLFPGRIGSDLGVPVGSKDVDFFLLTAPDTGTLILNVDTSTLGTDGVDGVLRVFDESFNEIAFNDDRTVGNRDPYLEISLVKGQRVYVAVADFDNRNFDPADPFSRVSTGTGGDYDLTISFDNDDQDGTVFDALERGANFTAMGVIGSDGSTAVGADGSQDVDFYQFTPANDGIIDLRVTSPDHSLVSELQLWVYDATADDVVQVGSAFGDESVLRAFVVSGETYYVSVTGQGNGDFDWFAPASGSGGDTGSYTLTSTRRGFAFAKPLTDDSVTNNTPEAISVGSQMGGEVGADGGFVVGAADVDVYRFVPTATQRIIIRALTNNEDAADTVLRVFDANGNQIRFNDDVSSTDRGSKVQMTVTAGQTYYIGINGYSPQAAAYNVLTGEGAVDGDTGSYVLMVSAAAAAEIDVAGLNGVAIVSGDIEPNTSDGTRFGITNVDGGTIVRDFTIFNTGSRVLNLTGTPRVMISGAQASEFAVVAQPAGTVARGTSRTFQIRFDPAAAGRRRATITIVSNDLDEGSYTFAIVGQGVLRPEITVTDATGSIAILSGDASPQTIDGTDFGFTAVGGTLERTFRIRNTGRKPLNLTGVPRVQISGVGGPGGGDFSVITLPGTGIRRNAFTTFTVRFAASQAGDRLATLTIFNNDPDEGTYTFSIVGRGV